MHHWVIQAHGDDDAQYRDDVQHCENRASGGIYPPKRLGGFHAGRQVLVPVINQTHHSHQGDCERHTGLPEDPQPQMRMLVIDMGPVGASAGRPRAHMRVNR